MLQIFGTINNPTRFADGPQGFFNLLSNIFKLAGTIAGIYFVFQIIMAGYGYLSANGDEKKVALAWSKIWQSLIGIIIIASAFILADVISRLTGGTINPANPNLYGPN